MKTRRLNGFSLIEVAIATGITTFCLLTLFGLLPIGLNLSHYASAQTRAANFASAISSDLRATPLTLAPVSPFYGFVIPLAGNPDSAPQTIYLSKGGGLTKINEPSNGESLFRATLWFSAPERAGYKHATIVRMLITWPADTDANPKANAAHFTGSFEALTALDRN